MIAYDAAGGADGGTAANVTYSHTCTGTNLILLVGVTIESGTDELTGVTYNGVAMTQIAKTKNTDNNEWAYLYYLLNPAIGAHNVVASVSPNRRIISRSASYTGVKQSAQPDNSNTKNQAGTLTISNSLTTVADNCWVVSYGHNTGANIAAGTGTTLRGAHTVGRAIGDNGAAKTPAGAVSMAWDNSITGAMQMIMASLAPYLDTSVKDILGGGIIPFAR